MQTAFPSEDNASFIMEFEGQPFINLTGISLDRCKRCIHAFGNSIRNSGTLAEAEHKAAHTAFDFGGDFRDLRHLLVTETQAALLAVERRHFELGFTTC